MNRAQMEEIRQRAELCAEATLPGQQLRDLCDLTSKALNALTALDKVLEFNEPWTDGSDATDMDRERLNDALAMAHAVLRAV